MRKLFSVIFLILGILLLLAALLTVGLTHYFKSQNNPAEILGGLKELIPEPIAAYPENKGDMQMPVIEYNNTDYIGIIEIPQYSRSLPVCSEWNKYTVNALPCRYSGSIYDSSLVIGGSDEEGQFDFSKLISVGDSIFFTDVSGARFSLKISSIEITGDIPDFSKVESFDLAVFITNTSALDYTVIYCNY